MKNDLINDYTGINYTIRGRSVKRPNGDNYVKILALLGPICIHTQALSAQKIR